MNALDQLKHLNDFIPQESGDMPTASRNLLWNRRGEFLRDHGPEIADLIEAALRKQERRFAAALNALTKEQNP